MTVQEILNISVKALDDKKAVDILALEVSGITTLCDYMVIAEGTSSTQVKALADEVEERLKKAGAYPPRKEGYEYGNWILLDYIGIVIHIFYSETRKFYSLERLWQDGKRLDISELLK